MRNYIIILACLLAFSNSNTLSVKDFGAAGDGTTDDTNAINSCLAAAQSAGKNVLFPAGTYLCNKADGVGHVLKMDISGKTGITIYSTGGATIKSTRDSLTVLFYVTAFSAASQFTVTGIDFLSTHGKISLATTAVFVTGNAGQNVTDYALTHCVLTGFSTAVVTLGVNNPTFFYDTLLHPHGHDDALQTTDPAVDMWFFDNAGGYCTNTNIQYCYFRGYTGTFPMPCKRPMDGGIYGVSYGWNIANNDFGFCSEEIIGIQQPNSNPSTPAACYIGHNQIDESLPPGCLNDDSSPHKKNYGIRSDCSNVTIEYNTFKNYTQGCLVYGFQFPTLSPANYNISHNTFLAPPPTDTTYSSAWSVFIQGNAAHPIPGVNVHDNTIIGKDSTDITILTTVSAVSPRNSVSPVKIF